MSTYTIPVSLLDDLRDYFDERQDADGVPSGGGCRPNAEMTLLVRLLEECRPVPSHPAAPSEQPKEKT